MLLCLIIIGAKGVITDEISIIVSSLVKLYIGELMEQSIAVMKDQCGDDTEENLDNVTTDHIK